MLRWVWVDVPGASVRAPQSVEQEAEVVRVLPLGDDVDDLVADRGEIGSHGAGHRPRAVGTWFTFGTGR